jgi:hypothetical protein
MNYRIKRGDQEFGPYSLADLQRYVQTGHVGIEDLAQSEGMSEWIPVSQVLGDIPVPPAPQMDAYGGMGAYDPNARQIVPLPPNLHWGWLLLLNVLTRSYFNIIWAFIQANWARKLSGKNSALVLISMYPAGVICGGVAIGLAKVEDMSGLAGFGGLLVFAGLICMVFGTFQIRSAMEDYYNSVENIGLVLGPVMTFFFGIIYLQYHINRIARWKKTGSLS